jgi:transcriptional repressor NrdR
MQCPICRVDNDRVVDSRLIGEGNVIRRRRECAGCKRRFTTYERIEKSPRLVVKKDQRREFFDRQKILGGMMKACQKRRISPAELEAVTEAIESEIYEEFDGEVPTAVIGEKVSEALKKLDQVAFVRFASVYRDFTDVQQFQQVLALLTQLSNGKPAKPGLAAGSVPPGANGSRLSARRLAGDGREQGAGKKVLTGKP